MSVSVEEADGRRPTEKRSEPGKPRPMALRKLAASSLLLALWWGACNGGALQEPTPSPDPPLPSPVRVGLVEMGELNTLDPARAVTPASVAVVWQVHRRLVGLGDGGEVLPDLAESWSPDESRTEWTFNLRAGETFSDGRPVTPEDAAFSLKRALRLPGYGATLLGGVVEGGQGSSIRVEGADLVVTLARPFAFLPERLASSPFSIIPAGTPDDGEAPPVGAGALQIERWDRDIQEVALAAWRTVPPEQPSSFLVRAYTESTPAVSALASGSLHWFEGPGSARVALAASLPPGATTTTPAGTEIRLVVLNGAAPEIAGVPGLGRALNLATDRAELLRAIGGGDPLAGPFPAGVAGAERCRIGYDATAAVEALGRRDSPVRLEMLVQPGDQSRVLAEMLRAQWARVGVEVSLQLGLADFVDRVVGGRYQIALGSFGPFLPTAEQYLWPYRADARPAPNVMGYADAAFEEALSAYTAGGTGSSPALDRALDRLCAGPPAVWLVRPAAVSVSTIPIAAAHAGGLPLLLPALR